MGCWAYPDTLDAGAGPAMRRLGSIDSMPLLRLCGDSCGCCHDAVVAIAARVYGFTGSVVTVAQNGSTQHHPSVKSVESQCTLHACPGSYEAPNVQKHSCSYLDRSQFGAYAVRALDCIDSWIPTGPCR